VEASRRRRKRRRKDTKHIARYDRTQRLIFFKCSIHTYKLSLAETITSELHNLVMHFCLLFKQL